MRYLGGTLPRWMRGSCHLGDREFQDVMAERKHAAIGAVGDLYSASGQQPLGTRGSFHCRAETSTPPDMAGCRFAVGAGPPGSPLGVDQIGVFEAARATADARLH